MLLKSNGGDCFSALYILSGENSSAEVQRFRSWTW